ncbi:MAG: hypothetical protein Q9162_006742, partial [Coniocarpon cinnabarinum]
MSQSGQKPTKEIEPHPDHESIRNFIMKGNHFTPDKLFSDFATRAHNKQKVGEQLDKQNAQGPLRVSALHDWVKKLHPSYLGAKERAEAKNAASSKAPAGPSQAPPGPSQVPPGPSQAPAQFTVVPLAADRQPNQQYKLLYSRAGTVPSDQRPWLPRDEDLGSLVSRQPRTKGQSVGT